ncbi:MAG: MFS transporter [Planctomycetota bacterium]
MTDTTYAADDECRGFLFATCFVALIATSFAFIIRAFIIDEQAVEFGLSEAQKGELFGAGLWPFAISIVLFSLVIDRVGYGRALWFAFACHVISVIVTLFARGYWGLYLGNFIAALGNGTVEAVINPVIATVFWKQKTKWLNILHAGWPGGLVIGGLLTLGVASFFTDLDWRWKVGLLLIPTIVYGVMLLRTHFPINERVAAGVPYKAMLAEFGAFGALVAGGLVIWELARVGGTAYGIDPQAWRVTAGVIIGLVVVSFGLISQSFGRPLFGFLLIVMLLLATTELGTDAWIRELMSPAMERSFDIDGGWVLIYTASIMIVLRLFCGPIVKLLNPLGLLAVSCLFAAAGLALLSGASGIYILLAATVYGIGQTFFWPTTLGLVAEQFPKGGALTLNAIAGVGMLGVGVLGAPLLGQIQDRHIERTLVASEPELAATVLGQPMTGAVGSYRKIDADLEKTLPQEKAKTLDDARAEAKQSALLQVTALPLVMFVCYVGLLIYFKSRGGYRPETIMTPT